MGTLVVSGLNLQFSRTLRPLPQASRDLVGQPMTELSSDHAYLSTMVAFMRDKVREEVHDIERKTRNLGISIEPEFMKADNALATPF